MSDQRDMRPQPKERSTHNFRLQALQHEVASAALSGVPREAIEEQVIDSSAVSDEEKAALRLYSWSFLSRFELRRMALDRLRDLSRGDGGPGSGSEPNG